MSYPETAAAYVQAARNNPVPAVDRLPMSAKVEDRRADMTPQTIAVNHALYVESAAAGLRNVLAYYDAAPDKDSALSAPVWADDIATAARALLAAIGEGEA